MWINSVGQIYQGDCALGDREATQEEVQAWDIIKNTPTIEQQIQSIKDQMFNSTIGIGAISGDEEDLVLARSLYAQLEALKAQL